MCSEGKTYVIDPEFAFYGPMGFDSGAFVANLLLAYVSQEGHPDNGPDYAEWILEQTVTFWNTLVQEFTRLWEDPQEHTGFQYGRETLAGSVKACQDAFFAELLNDTLGFAGMKMLRRIVGIAHVEDLESIDDLNVRAKCERRGLRIAQTFIQSSSTFASIEDAVNMARKQE